MKLQSAIEFLSTYGFMFLIVSLILILIFYFAFPVQSVVQDQCSIFGSLQCGFVIFHINAANTANVIFSLSNSGSAPINVIKANVIINGRTFQGGCTPTLLSPGSGAICNATVSPSKSIGSQVHGYLSVSVDYCNSLVSKFGNVISQANCTYNRISYTGEFFSYATLITANTISSTSITIPATITYAGNGATAANIINGPSGYSTYLCNVGNGVPTFVTPYSWTTDSSFIFFFIWASAGHQTLSKCAAGNANINMDSMSALGLNNVPLFEPSVRYSTSSLSLASGLSTKITYTIPSTSGASGHFVVISIPCSEQACSFVSPPYSSTTGTTPCSVISSVSVGSSSSSYIAVCDYNQDPGTYQITITSAPGGTGRSSFIAAAVYDYGAKS